MFYAGAQIFTTPLDNQEVGPLVDGAFRISYFRSQQTLKLHLRAAAAYSMPSQVNGFRVCNAWGGGCGLCSDLTSFRVTQQSFGRSVRGGVAGVPPRRLAAAAATPATGTAGRRGFFGCSPPGRPNPEKISPTEEERGRYDKAPAVRAAVKKENPV